MDTNQTLHDFVLNLITNQDARLTFQLDPEGTLQAAGLGDLTPADVQDVVPLVVDLVPLQGLASLGEPLGLGGLTAAPANVVGQLQGIVEQLPLNSVLNGTTTADINLSALGAITVSPNGLGNGGVTTQAGGDIVAHPPGTAPLMADTDVATTLDAGLISSAGGGQVTADATLSGGGEVSGDLVGGLTGNLLGGTLNVVGGLTGSLTAGLGGNLLGGDLVGGTLDTVTGLAGGLTGGDAGLVGGTLETVTSLTAGLTGGDTGLVGGALDTVTGLTGGLTGGDAGLLGGTLDTVTGVTGGLTGGDA
ncbi:IniB N-terminal domain-containing protein, partial [Allorhizocola rhizosphaerae]|uniref:IniB N-terminal domain-containing protein n=1 Tax=Allorhizocola rhizosphaerae TaxID=1872709 RepID=UPI001B8CC3FA